jgi:hypothetical protein
MRKVRHADNWVVIDQTRKRSKLCFQMLASQAHQRMRSFGPQKERLPESPAYRLRSVACPDVS